MPSLIVAVPGSRAPRRLSAESASNPVVLPQVFRATLIGAFLLILPFLMSAARAQPADSWRERNLPVYQFESREEIRELQLSLFINRCYGNQLRSNQVDGVVGPLTKRAIDVFVAEHRVRRGTNITRPADLARRAMDLRASTQANAKFCERSAYLARYFSDPAMHRDWRPKYASLYPEGEANVWVMKTALWQHACYGRVFDTTEYEFKQDFGSYSRRALHVFVEQWLEKNPGKAIASPERLLAILQSQPRAYCEGSKFFQVYFASGPGNPEQCSFPLAADRWLDSLGSNPDSYPLGAAMRSLDEAFATYLSEVKEPDAKRAIPLGVYGHMRDARDQLWVDMRQLLKTRDRLARYGALLKYDACRNCMLLADYDALAAIASHPVCGRRYLVAKLPGASAKADEGPPAQCAPPAYGMDIAKLDFELIQRAHLKIKDWREKQDVFEAQKDGIAKLSETEIAAKAAEFAKAARAAETARVDMLADLWADWQERTSPPEGDPVGEFAAKRDTWCGAGITFTEGSQE